MNDLRVDSHKLEDMIYKAEYFNTNADGATNHMPAGLEELLNKRAVQGWILRHMFQVSVGYLVVFERSH